MINSSKYKKIADYLQQNRRNHHISIRKISQQANLPEMTIRALERPSKSDLPRSNISGLYVVYGRALGVPSKKIETLMGPVSDYKPEFRLKQLPKIKSLVIFSNIGVRIIGAIFISIATGYLVLQGLVLVSAPDLKVAMPRNSYMVVDKAEFVVSGQASNESIVLVNGEPTIVNSEGEFHQPVYLQLGYNRLTIKVVNSFSSTATKDFVVIYQRKA